MSTGNATDDFIDQYYKDRQRGKQPQQHKPEDIIMANKFLPFIVEKSTPEHIYRTLLSRSKGMNINLVTSIFYMVIEKGVNELREFVKTLPDGISVTQMYEEMVGKYAHYQIMDEDLNQFVGLAPILSRQDWAKMNQDMAKDLDSKDIMAFLFVMYQVGSIAEYTDLNFDDYFAKADQVLSNLPEYIQFSDNGEPITFRDENHLRSWILYQTLLTSNDDDLGIIKVVFKKEDEESEVPF